MRRETQDFQPFSSSANISDTIHFKNISPSLQVLFIHVHTVFIVVMKKVHRTCNRRITTIYEMDEDEGVNVAQEKQ
mgnify:FL=1